jgi:hypothetical protein
MAENAEAGGRRSYLLVGIALAAVVLALPATSVRADDAAAVAPDLPPGDTPPPSVFDRIEEAGTAEEHDGADYVIVYERTANRVEPSGVTYTDEYTLYKILTPAGCRDRSVQTWHYEPWSSHLDVREVSIERVAFHIRGGLIRRGRRLR